MKKTIYLLLAFFILVGCNKTVNLMLEEESGVVMGDAGAIIFNKNAPEQTSTQIVTNGDYEFTIQLKSNAIEDQEILLSDESSLSTIVEQYNNFNLTKEYQLLPSSYYSISPIQISKGSQSTDLTLTIQDYQDLDQGVYVLPLRFTINGENIIHTVQISKDSEFSMLSQNNKKPLPIGEFDCAERTEPIKMVAYVETNDWDIRNLAQFVLADSKKPVFDYITIFAANMNYDEVNKKRVLYFNDKLQPFVKDPTRYTKPLHDRGIKLLVDILPNHQGVGYYNFQSYEDALEFAKECKTWADKLGIDGFDIDEEYARYDVRPELPRKGNESILWFMRAMKEVMPDKILSLYEYGNSLTPSSVDEWGKYSKDYLDFTVSDYNVFGSSQVGMPNELYGRLSVEASRTYLIDFPDFSQTELENRANQIITNCNGYFMIFNIKGSSIKSGDAAKSISHLTRKFYGEETIFSGKYYPGPSDQ